jgi:aminopeptidase N
MKPSKATRKVAFFWLYFRINCPLIKNFDICQNNTESMKFEILMRNLILLCSALLLSLKVIAFTPPVGSSVSVDTAHYYMKHSYDVVKYKLDIDIYHCYPSPYLRDFTAVEIITFKVDSALNSIKLNAINSSLTIDSVKLNAVSFTHLSDTLKILLNRTFQPGEVLDIKIFYKHKNVYDHGFYASGGYVFTDTPPEGSRKWFPCWDRPSDKALLDLTAKVPATVKLGSNGTLADSVHIADTIWYHWISRDPISTYLITITSKLNFDLNIIYWHLPDNPNDSIPIRFYFKSPENPMAMEQVIIPMSTFYSEKFGVYPFEKIGFATLSSAFPWGGMENQTMINLQSNGWQEGLISHEFSHQWFGDLITCGTWADVWLNESFGTYCESLWLEHTTGYSAYKSHLDAEANQYLGANPGLPIYNPLYAIHTPDPNTLYSTSLVYNKGACVLHQLRYILGDSIFFQLIHSYATDTNFIFKNAVTDDFVQKANQVSGQDLTWFFHEWIYSRDHPEYHNTYEFQDIGNGKWNVKFLLTQTQDQTVFFKMPVQLQVQFTDLTDTLIQVLNDVDDQVFEFTFSREPKSVVFDPYRNILLKQATTILGIHDKKKLKGYQLEQNVPNPFRNSTVIKYQVPKPSAVKISVFDSAGNLIESLVNRNHESGKYSLQFDRKSLSPGVYLYKMESGNFNDSRRMVIVK